VLSAGDNTARRPRLVQRGLHGEESRRLAT
jgi:hypothetical protein